MNVIIVVLFQFTSKFKQMKSLKSYKIGNTPLFKANKYCPNGNIYLKMEMYNLSGSIKIRTAFYMLKDLYEKNKINSKTTVIESTSGNLGIALSFFTKALNINFLCLIDPLINRNKFDELKKMSTNIYKVQETIGLDYRSSRIKLAKELDKKDNYFWLNQYENLSNVKAHYETTGPEIWKQTNGNIDYLISTVGSGGTISGTALFLKEQNSNIKVIGVEPYGSCIFGGKPSCYISAGAGMTKPSNITEFYLYLIDEAFKVRDNEATQECESFFSCEGVKIGHTSGMCLCIAKKIIQKDKKANIIIIAADSDYLNF